jgi:FkbM family methyltransferase
VNVISDLIYDVGMHDGNDTAYYLARGYRVVAVEADPVQAEEGQRRFAGEIASGRLTILNIAIAECEKTSEFWINPGNPQLNSFDREAAARFDGAVHSIEVPCTRLDTVLATQGTPHYLKIDIEGYDLVCCEQLTPETKPPYISVEMWQLEILLRLRDLGYDRFKLVDQYTLRPVTLDRIKTHVRVLRWFHRVANRGKENRSAIRRLVRYAAARVLAGAEAAGLGKAPPPFRSKALPNWNFAAGCSGTFGDDIPGDWLTWQQIQQLWDRDHGDQPREGVEFWRDIHATCSSVAS